MTRPLPDAPADTTRVGYFLGPQGVQGGVKLFVLGEAEQLRQLRRVWVERLGWLKVSKVELLYPGVALYLAGICSRDAAQELRELNVYADDKELPALEEGRYYYHQLRGLTLLSPEGEPLGTVSDVLDVGHQDLLVVAHAQGESFVPLQAPYVQLHSAQGLPTGLQLTEEAPEGLLGTDETGE